MTERTPPSSTAISNGTQQHVRDLARAGVHGREVASRLRRRVADEVLERRVHARRLQAAHVRRADRADDVRVLGDALVDPPPARVADDVEHRRQALVDAERAHRPADRAPISRHEVRVERRTPRQRRRERRRPPGRQPGQALLVHERRDAQPRLADQPALQRPTATARARPRRPAGCRRRRVRCPRPCRVDVVETAARPSNSPCSGATASPSPFSQKPTSCASFSSSVIRASSSLARVDAGTGTGAGV